MEASYPIIEHYYAQLFAPFMNLTDQIKMDYHLFQS
jgi:hypothetical protein